MRELSDPGTHCRPSQCPFMGRGGWRGRARAAMGRGGHGPGCASPVPLPGSPGSLWPGIGRMGWAAQVIKGSLGDPSGPGSPGDPVTKKPNHAQKGSPCPPKHNFPTKKSTFSRPRKSTFFRPNVIFQADLFFFFLILVFQIDVPGGGPGGRGINWTFIFVLVLL